jgi:hypothetical protein
MENLLRFSAIIVAFIILTGMIEGCNPFIVSYILPCPPGTITGDYGACVKSSDVGHN